MAHLIDKDALVAEIERLRERFIAFHHRDGCDWPLDNYGKMRAYNELLSFINTLEVKEVDLIKEVANWKIDHQVYGMDETFYDFAEHFFKLGVKANNPITSADRGTAEEIIINLKKIESDYNVCLTKEIEWVRKQVGQPELKAK